MSVELIEPDGLDHLSPDGPAFPLERSPIGRGASFAQPPLSCVAIATRRSARIHAPPGALIDQATHVEELRREVRFRRDRLARYRARTYALRAGSETRLAELQRVLAGAEARLNRALYERSDRSPAPPEDRNGSAGTPDVPSEDTSSDTRREDAPDGL